MGGLVSKQTSESPSVQINGNLQYIAEMRSYEDACRDDPDIQSFDTKLRIRTNRVMNTVVANVDLRSLSFNSLIEITGGILETNQEAVKIILNYQKDVWKNQQLFELVEEYFANSFHMLEFCTALEKCLNRARDKQLIIRFALHRFEEEDGAGTSNESNGTSNDGNGANHQEKYFKTLEELKKFKIVEDPFTEEFFQILRKVHEQQLSMLDKLILHQRKINKKLKSRKVWRKVSNIIFVTVFVTVVICSVVTAAIAAPPIAAALAAAAAVPLGTMGKWFDSLWKRYQVELEEHGKLISSMQVRTVLAIRDLESIRALVDRLKMQIESMMENANFVLRGEVEVKLGIEEIKKSVEMFMQNLEVLGEHSNKCSESITKGRMAILQKIKNQK